ncbi:hypothetical protein ACFQI7_33555 [Paenibacillus allorhizosphaerae]|uniref:Uncharacterized protein n=1 Tax=Paenibacillus allorhizosphaerae TaxID=2849866 RepID=A0ABM8VTI7_9BACL|nr:hypothetical protein [Paenibacillus allorhizosphaerae]CAG7657859.1 hypothetical protein PAECIP111802_06879 [Paenibacillus allorhizosphaerae]
MINWITIAFSLFVSVASLYKFIAEPIKYGMKSFILLTVIGCITMIAAIVQYWYAYLPKVGPIGNGPNDTMIWISFLILITLGGCYVVAGVYGIGKNKETDKG